MNRRKLLYRLRLDNHSILYHYICYQVACASLFVVDWNAHLPFKGQTLFPKFIAKGIFIQALKQAGT